MGYCRMTLEALYQIYRRWNTGQSKKRIAEVEGKDRKTISYYIKQFRELGFRPGESSLEKEVILQKIKHLLPQSPRIGQVEQSLLGYLNEIKDLIHHPSEPVKPKTAWEIVKLKYQIPGSYESFKIFARKHNISKKKTSQTIRIELPPGLETQIDYGQVGRHHDPTSQKNRIVNAFCGILSSSRLPFVEFTYTQKGEEFVESNINMLEFYGGATEFISLDNLKAGVIKPDLYEPTLNKAYQEMAEHYGVFLDPCRPGKPKDKGKVERIVPLARELFRKLKTLYPGDTLKELNEKAKEWCLNEYGMRNHGTTHEKPLLVFKEKELPRLKQLPQQRFEIPFWKFPKVHPDQFFSFDKKRYSLPLKYAGKRMAVKRVKNRLFIYFDHQLIRTYFITNKAADYHKEDFPEIKREMMDGGYPKYLLNKARSYGENSYSLIKKILDPHAFLNARRAQAVIGLLEDYKSLPLFSDICKKALKKGIKDPKRLKRLFEDEKEQQHFDFILEMSPEGEEMLRDVEYFWN